MRNILITIFLALSLAINLGGCTNTTAKKAIEEGKISIASREYDKALSLFKLAIDEGGNKEAKDNYDILYKYLNAKTAFENLEYEQALEMVEEIVEVDTYENLKNDINLLKEEIIKKKDIIDTINSEIEKINKLIDEGNIDEADKVISQLKLEEVPEDILKSIEEIKIIIEEKKAQKIEDDKNAIIAKGLNIIKEYGYTNMKFEKVVNDDFSVKEISNKDLYLYYNNNEESHDEFYYDPVNNKMYMINQGMWFIINENYKNVTPKDSQMYEAAEDYRNRLLGEKIKFTKSDAEKIAKPKLKSLGLIDVVITEDVKAINNIKLYYAAGQTDTRNHTVFEFFVGSDGNLYDFTRFAAEGKLVKLK